MNHEAKMRRAEAYQMGVHGSDTQAHQDAPRICGECDGSGEVELDPEDFPGCYGPSAPWWSRCPECEGEGTVGG